jgi:hypothetical protein
MTSRSIKSERPGIQWRRKLSGKLSGSTHSNASLPYRRPEPRSVGTDSPSSSPWQNVAGQQQSTQEDVLGSFNYVDFGSSRTTTSRSQSTVSQYDNQFGISAPPPSLTSNNLLHFYDQASSQSMQSNDAFTSHSSPDPAAWQPGEVCTPTSSHMDSLPDDMFFPDGQSGVGRSESFNSFPSSSLDAMESAFSDNFGFIDASPPWGLSSSNDRMLDDQFMPSTSLHIPIPCIEQGSCVESQELE